ncbi:MAG: type II toxin-antitoxin system PemK/MazF family toxin [Acidimicrobiales bacterium]
MTSPQRGEVWWAEVPDAGRRPVLVLTRDAAIGKLNKLVVAPITRTVRGIPTEVELDESDGMPKPCAVSLDNVSVVDSWALTDRICALDVIKLERVCESLRVAVDC